MRSATRAAIAIEAPTRPAMLTGSMSTFLFGMRIDQVGEEAFLCGREFQLRLRMGVGNVHFAATLAKFANQ